MLPGRQVPYPAYPHAEARDAAVYVRPHEFTIEHRRNGGQSIEARVLHINPTGSRTKVDLRAVDFDLSISAEITDEKHAELRLKPGDTVHVAPRRVRVFMP